MNSKAALVLGLVFILFLGVTTVSFGAERILVFEDTFDDAEATATKWDFENGMGTVQNGTLVSPPDQDFARAFPRVDPIRLGEGEATSIEFEVDYRTRGPVFPWDSPSYLGVHAIGQQGQRFEVLVWSDAYEAKYRLDERGPEVEKARAVVPSPRGPGDAPDFATYDTHGGALETGDWVHLRLVMQADGLVAVYLNDERILEYTKESGISQTFGRFLVFSRHGFQQWEFDRVAIYVIK